MAILDVIIDDGGGGGTSIVAIVGVGVGLVGWGDGSMVVRAVIVIQDFCHNIVLRVKW